MRNCKKGWESIFTQMLRFIYTLGNNAVSVTEIGKFYLNKTKIVSGSRTIIDDILLFCINFDAILVFVEFICKLFLKYKVSFRPNKCDYLKNWVEYVGRDVTKVGNYLARCKFDLINYWILSTTGQSLFSLIGVVYF